MSNYRLIASDLDGTFLNSEMKVTPENNAAIAALLERGILFVPASGRSFYEMDTALQENPLMRYYINSDGAVDFDKKTGERDTACMDRALCNRIFDILQEYIGFIVLHYDGNAYYDPDKMNPEGLALHRITPYYGALVAQQDLAAEHFTAFCRSREEVEQIFVFFHSDEEMAECRGRLEAIPEIQVVSSEPGTFEIVSAQAGKGNGLKRLAKKLGVPIEQTIAVGDSCNDLSMLQAAGLSLAVSNGWEQVKEQADRVICSNDEHIVAYIAEHIL